MTIDLSGAHIRNPEAIGNPNDTPVLQFPNLDTPCDDCSWDAQAMFNGRWAILDSCANHAGTPIPELPGLVLATSPVDGRAEIRHVASGIRLMELPELNERHVQIVAPHLSAVDWTVSRDALLADQAVGKAVVAAAYKPLWAEWPKRDDEEDGE
jgi:hypothetical protein